MGEDGNRGRGEGEGGKRGRMNVCGVAVRMGRQLTVLERRRRIPIREYSHPMLNRAPHVNRLRSTERVVPFKW